jgi:hypothetical protein
MKLKSTEKPSVHGMHFYNALMVCLYPSPIYNYPVVKACSNHFLLGQPSHKHTNTRERTHRNTKDSNGQRVQHHLFVLLCICSIEGLLSLHFPEKENF